MIDPFRQQVVQKMVVPKASGYKTSVSKREAVLKGNVWPL